MTSSHVLLRMYLFAKTVHLFVKYSYAYAVTHVAVSLGRPATGKAILRRRPADDLEGAREAFLHALDLDPLDEISKASAGLLTELLEEIRSR